MDTSTTTTTTTTTEGVVLESKTESETTVDNETTQGQWSDHQSTGEGQWQEVNPDGDNYVKGEVTTTDMGSKDINPSDPLEDQDVTLNMTQSSSEASERIDVSYHEAVEAEIPEGYADGAEFIEGNTKKVVTWQRDSSGKVVGYTVTATTTTEGTLTPAQPDEHEKSGAETSTSVAPSGYTPGQTDITDSQGNSIGKKTVEEIKDADGKVIGYKITEEVHSKSGYTTNTTTDPDSTTVTLPTKPVPAAPYNDNGLDVTETVEDIYENGVLVGYKTITRKTAPATGIVHAEETKSVYATTAKTTSSTENIPTSDEVVTTTVTTVYGTELTQNYTQTTDATKTNVKDITEDIYQLVNTENGMYLLYQAKLYKVEAIGQQGSVSMQTLVPNLNLEPGSSEGDLSGVTDLRHPKEHDITVGKQSGYEYQYVGYGLESSICVWTGSKSTLVHQFELKDSSGKSHYVYCVDYSTNAKAGASYNMDNVVDAGYFSSTDAAKHAELVALYGFWGSDSVIGSLVTVKQMLRDAKKAGNAALANVSYDEINALTEGQALTATQAALWKYGDNKGSNLGSNIVGNSYIYGDKSNVPAADKKITNALYSYLINQSVTATSNPTTELIDKDNYATEASITIKERATNDDGSAKTEGENEVFICDVNFVMDVKKSDITGNLVLTVTVPDGKGGQKTIKTIQLATEDSNLLGSVIAGGKTVEGKSQYTIENLELAENVKFNLNLSGVQNMEEGAYLYTAAAYTGDYDNSQTFIGVASGEQRVNLTVGMDFKVEDPGVQLNHTKKTWKETDEDSFVKVDNSKKVRNDVTTNQTVTVETTVIGTTVKTEVETAVTKEKSSWKYWAEYLITVVDDEDGGAGTGNQVILDEAVPLAAAPKTGDATVILATVCLISLGGALVLMRKEKFAK